jgi:elongation factor 1-beta
MDEDDLFGDDDDGEDAAALAAAAKAKATAPKKVIIGKSIILWEVKPWGIENDLDVLAKKILAITKDGLKWKTEYKKEPVAYGIFKIVIGAVIEDDKVSTDDIQEIIEGFEDEVQSVGVLSFNKV